MNAIVVVNPNSSRDVTAGIDRALEPLRRPGSPPIRCLTLAEGPPGIETEDHVRDVIAPLVALVRRLDGEAAAFVDACFSDPGLAELRRATARPVFGIAESAYHRATADAGRFGVISLFADSATRHRRYVEALGFGDALAGDRPVGLGVTALGDDPAATFDRLVKIGRELRDADAAAAIVLGCTGMAPHRAALEDALQVPVIDPTQAAVAAAIDAIDAIAATP
jgi:Asp/Glu/hydantoin racemase